MNNEEQKWETVAGNVIRLEVNGGWIYKVYSFGGNECIVYVPDPDIWTKKDVAVATAFGGYKIST